MDIRGGTFSISINIPTKRKLEDVVRERFRTGQGFALATVNVDHLVKLDKDPDFASAYAAQDLVVADGNPVVWLARLGGERVELITGSDQVVPLVRWASECDAPVALFGSTPEALEEAAAGLLERVPKAQIVAKISPPFGFDPLGDEAGELLEQLNASGARLCLLALGAPKQEIFAARGRRECPKVGFASIGAGLDFIAGHQTRAPRWVRAVAMEWAWRMLTNPKRLARRYAECALVLPGHAGRALAQRLDK